MLTVAIPARLLSGLVKLVTGSTEDLAETATAFFKSRIAVQEALSVESLHNVYQNVANAHGRHMLRDELNEMTEDKWDDEIWGAAALDAQSSRTKLVFYFAAKDGWIADQTRDDLIKARALKEDEPDQFKPRMYIDDAGVPHDFCVSKLDSKFSDWVEC